MSVRISSLLLARLRAEADASPDVEVCGLLFGSVDEIEVAQPTTNVSVEPARAFEIDPAALFAAIRAERTGGPGIIGNYHSHPSGPARPSPCDAAAVGETGRLWLILGRHDVTVWRAMPHGPVEGAFEPIMLEVVGEAVALGDVNRHKGAVDRV